MISNSLIDVPMANERQKAHTGNSVCHTLITIIPNTNIVTAK